VVTGGFNPFPDRAFVACKDTAASIRQRIMDRGISLPGLIILSARDNPALNTLDSVIAALPESIRFLAMDDIEYLLPANQRDPEAVLCLVLQLDQFIAKRGISTHVTTAVKVTSKLMKGGVS